MTPCSLLLHSSVASLMGLVLETNLAEMDFALVGVFTELGNNRSLTVTVIQRNIKKYQRVLGPTFLQL